MHARVRALKVLLSDKCQWNRKVNINFSIVKVRCVPRFIVTGIFIVAAVRKDILSSALFARVRREGEQNFLTCIYTLLREKCLRHSLIC